MPESRNRLWADDTVERYDKMMNKIVSDIEKPPGNFLGGLSITRIVEHKRKR